MPEAEKQVQEPNYLEMSDEDIMKMGDPPARPIQPVAPESKSDDAVVDEASDNAKDDEEEGDETTDQRDEDSDEDDAEDADDEVDEAQAESDESDADDDEAPVGKAPKAQDEPQVKGDGKQKASADPKAKDAAQTDGKPADLDYKKEYDRLLAPFKANGRDIKVDSVDDAITLMQMGANYNKKMAALKPNLKLMKMLENNKLLSEEKISFLIDLEKKNPAAINKLIKESGIDPMEIDTEKASEYKRTSYAVADSEIELDTVLDELQGSPTYNQLLEVVGNKWDAASKQVVAQSPQLLRVVNDHISCGIYDLISTEIERERTFGRLTGMSDIEAYRKVGDALHAKGAFNHLTKGSSQGQGKPAAQPGSVIQPKPKKVDDDTRKDKRRAASPSKPVAPTLPAGDFNPLSMSDEEFSKLAEKRYA
jgi:hypothetical protein